MKWGRLTPVVRGKRPQFGGGALAAAGAVTLAALSMLLVTSDAHAAAWKPDVGAAARYAASRPGSVAFSIRWGGEVRGYRSHEKVVAASTVKTMLLLAYLRRPGVRSSALSREQRHLLAPMIR